MSCNCLLLRMIWKVHGASGSLLRPFFKVGSEAGRDLEAKRWIFSCLIDCEQVQRLVIRQRYLLWWELSVLQALCVVKTSMTSTSIVQSSPHLFLEILLSRNLLANIFPFSHDSLIFKNFEVSQKSRQFFNREGASKSLATGCSWRFYPWILELDSDQMVPTCLSFHSFFLPSQILRRVQDCPMDLSFQVKVILLNPFSFLSRPKSCFWPNQHVHPHPEHLPLPPKYAVYFRCYKSLNFREAYFIVSPSCLYNNIVIIIYIN